MTIKEMTVEELNTEIKEQIDILPIFHKLELKKIIELITELLHRLEEGEKAKEFTNEICKYKYLYGGIGGSRLDKLIKDYQSKKESNP